MKKETKTEIIAELSAKFQKASSLYLADFTGIKVNKMEHLRNKFRQNNSDFKVVKNTLAKLALKKAGYSVDLDQYLLGPTGIAFGYDDPIAPAKVLSEFLKEKENENLKVKICVIEKQVYDGKKIADIAKMPTKKDLLAQLLGLFNSPMQNVVMVLNAPMQNLVGVLESLKTNKAA